MNGTQFDEARQSERLRKVGVLMVGGSGDAKRYHGLLHSNIRIRIIESQRIKAQPRDLYEIETYARRRFDYTDGTTGLLYVHESMTDEQAIAHMSQSETTAVSDATRVP